MNRDSAKSSIENCKSAIEYAQRALKLSGAWWQPIERDFIRAHWLLGAAYLLNNQIDLADHHLSEALTRDRTIKLVDTEANILLDLARLRYEQKNYEEAKSLAEEALLITERCGYVLQGADVNLFLAQYALEQEKDKAKAKEYAETALNLAYCDGPPYYYKVAYEEAVDMLERLKV
jgi:tetratricopeptide (TPR) repeat protein